MIGYQSVIIIRSLYHVQNFVPVIIAHITKLQYQGIFFAVFTELLPRTTLVSNVRLQKSFGNELRVKRFISQSLIRSKKKLNLL